MTVLIGVTDKRTKSGYGERRFTLYSEALNYLNKHTARYITVIHDGYLYNYTTSKFKEIAGKIV